MTQNQDKFIARLPEGLRECLKKAANRNKRSMNAELVHALELHLFGEEYRVNKQAKEALELPESSLPVTRGDLDRLLIAFQAELAKKA
jgi:plasmid stability protein